jgi:ribosomal-protein-alanine N-acetyltransferase
MAAVEKAEKWKMVEITLEVRASNRDARAFYTGHGFTARGLRKGYYVDNGEDAIVMTRRVAGLRAP